jgi:hypothetical protein
MLRLRILLAHSKQENSLFVSSAAFAFNFADIESGCSALAITKTHVAE